MGQVWQAVDELLDRSVAVKLVRDGHSTRNGQRLGQFRSSRHGGFRNESGLVRAAVQVQTRLSGP